jgi:regulatory LuxR family protein
MRKLKEVLRLHSLGLSQHQIARSCSISQSTVHEYLSAAQAAGVKWPVPENWDDQQMERTLFPQGSDHEAAFGTDAPRHLIENVVRGAG